MARLDLGKVVPTKGLDYFTENDIEEIVEEVSNTIYIPTKLSEFQNDSGFIDNTYHDNTKQNVINDLDTIRSGASKGATSAQPSDLTDFITKDVNDLSYYYTKTETDSKISSVYKYRGSVATYQDLPDTNLTIGDVYNVETDGSNYAWDGTDWDKLGGTIDISGKEDKTNKVTSISSNSTDTEYPSAKAVFDTFSRKMIPSDTSNSNRWEVSELEVGRYYTNIPYENVFITCLGNTNYNLSSVYDHIDVVKKFSECEVGEVFMIFTTISTNSGGQISNSYFKKTSNSITQNNTGVISFVYSNMAVDNFIYEAHFQNYPYMSSDKQPTTNRQLTPKKYVDDKFSAVPVFDPTSLSGYDSSATQILKNINGTLTWVADYQDGDNLSY